MKIKYIWEVGDIRPGVKTRWAGRKYPITIIAWARRDVDHTLYALLYDDIAYVSDSTNGFLDAEAMAKFLNDGEAEPWEPAVWSK